MAKKTDHKGEEPVGWVTVKGKHFPKWKDGTIGWENGQESTSAEKVNEEYGPDDVTKKSDKQLANSYKTTNEYISAVFHNKNISAEKTMELVDKVGKRFNDIKSEIDRRHPVYEAGEAVNYYDNDSRKMRSGTIYSAPGSRNAEGLRQYQIKDKENGKNILLTSSDLAKTEASSAKTSVANTGSRNARYDTSRATTAKEINKQHRQEAAKKHEATMGDTYKQAKSNLATMGKGELATIARKLGIPNSLIRGLDADDLRAKLLFIYKGSHK